MAPLEAMASGCPTIYTRRGSGPELLQHGREGLLIDPDDSDEIANAIIQVQANPTFGREMGEAGRSRVRESFSLERLTTRNVEFYENCIRKLRPQGRRAA